MKHTNKINALSLYVALFVIGLLIGIVGALVIAKKNSSEQIPAKGVKYRDDVVVVFKQGLLDQLSREYSSQGTESLYCLIGRDEGDRIIVDTLAQGGTIEEGFDYMVFDEDPPCQIPGSVGSLHTHPSERGCEPSLDDMFTFGEMHSPEPVINAIQCAMREIHIFKMPGKREEFDFRRVRWE